MDGRPEITYASLLERVSWLCIFYLLFSVIYGFTGWYTSGLPDVPSVVLDFEHRIPFLSWMVLPYMSSGVFFVYVFYLASSKKDLYLLVKRLVFATVVAGIVYLLFPLQYSFEKPHTDGVFGFFFRQLSRWDTSFNQAPSLHITYAFIFWSVIRYHTSGIRKSFLAVWLILMGVSTLTVYQHHLIDILGALLLVPVIFLVFPRRTGDFREKNRMIAHVYFLFSAFFLFIAFGWYARISVYGLCLIGVSLPLFFVGMAYLKSDATFLKKKNGKIHWTGKCLYYPYILSYRLLWSCFRKNKHNPVTEILPGLFTGARLSGRQAVRLGLATHTVVFDLSAELEENKVLKNTGTYYCYPMLDMGGTQPERMDAITDHICEHYKRREPGEKIYIHCTMGYSRSMVIGVMLLMRLSGISRKEAVAILKEKHPQAVLPGYINEMN
ncbi:MAG: phosphatase PAP2/dual specificity phosphatase family protein [Tannerellaceae bacterium]|nr:phosphatase PAP2/dual specificity phosphatase family protein [Tannerellaceae bacterium]